MKKVLVIILALILVLALGAGCAKTDEGNADNADSAAVSVDKGTTTDDGVTDEENFKSSSPESTPIDIDLGVNLGAVDTGNMSLDEINMFESDDEASFRSGSGMDMSSMQKASEQD